MNILFLIGIAIFLGTISGKVFQRFKIPQVVGYIILGLLIGKSFLHVFEGEVVQSLQPLVNFTLGIIGCVIGSELKGSVFKKYGQSIYTILFAEGMFAFLLVTVFVTLITKKLYLGLILGAIASATDPASTINVLWEYKAKGPLTRTLTSVVALDDGLALIIYGIVSVFSKAMILEQTFSWWQGLGGPVLEIFECLALGAMSAVFVVKFCKHIKEEALVISFILGVICAGVGLSMYLNLDLILSSMAFGATMANMLPKVSEKIFGTIKEMTTSLYILFFVAMGAQLDIHTLLNPTILGIVLVYLVARSLGKIFGATLGGVITRAKKEVAKYTGLCLFTQGGVAMGLALSISHNLSQTGAEGQQVGLLIINVVAATTFVVQLIGPPCVKWAIIKAQEDGKNITEEDLMRTIKVNELMDLSYPIIKENTPLKTILNIFSDSPYTQYPVINNDGKITGIVNIDSIKNSLLLEDSGNLLLGDDMKQPFHYAIPDHSTLFEAKAYMDEFQLGFIPVVDEKESILGCFDRRMYQKFVSTKLLQLQHDEHL
jgi:Kef-type K+ transport system membrane component KefB/CBS domain-containing protein